MADKHVVVIGAGIGGLVSALLLARRGVAVTLVERAGGPGGKMRQVQVGGRPLDAGPTVFTMRWVFDEIFDEAGTSLEAELRIRPLEILARHAWSEEERLDLFAEPARSAEAIGDFAGAAEAQRFLDFCKAAQGIYRTLKDPFIRAPRPNPVSLVGRVGPSNLGGLLRIRPFDTMWKALTEHFEDPRLRQLFGRYATYCGSSPFLAPATLMLIAHVEQEGVWIVDGGMNQTAQALARVAESQGAEIRYRSDAAEILTDRRRATGVRLTSGERIAADAVVVNADAAALASGRFGEQVRRAVPPVPPAIRSLSAVTWNLVAETQGFPLLRHTVFFSRDYPDEFDAIFRRTCLPNEPTVYICAHDRDDRDGAAPEGPERLLCLVNAPAAGDSHPFDPAEIERCETRTFTLLERCGLAVARDTASRLVTTPADFHRLFPSTGGALYGQASHGWRASFSRPGTRSRVPGLYLAGGSVHPGAGVPMAALSGRLAATAVLSDLTSTSRSGRAATPGGTSTP